MAKDKEVAAITSIIALLKPLDPNERSRVLDYVLRRLEMPTVSSAPLIGVSGSGLAPEAAEVTGGSYGFRVKDIRSFTANKQPRSAIEMVALVAYYLVEVAPEAERASTINAAAVKKYFTMAGFPLPASLKNALTNAAAAGYLENVSRGEYRLNPVGYNLVVHGLPKGEGGVSMARKKKPKRRKKGK